MGPTGQWTVSTLGSQGLWVSPGQRDEKLPFLARAAPGALRLCVLRGRHTGVWAVREQMHVCCEARSLRAKRRREK